VHLVATGGRPTPSRVRMRKAHQPNAGRIPFLLQDASQGLMVRRVRGTGTRRGLVKMKMCNDSGLAVAAKHAARLRPVSTDAVSDPLENVTFDSQRSFAPHAHELLDADHFVPPLRIADRFGCNLGLRPPRAL